MYVNNFDKHKISPQNITKGFQNLAKVVKFRQIWSHWLQSSLCNSNSIGVISLTSGNIMQVSNMGIVR